MARWCSVCGSAIAPQAARAGRDWWCDSCREYTATGGPPAELQVEEFRPSLVTRISGGLVHLLGGVGLVVLVVALIALLLSSVVFVVVR